MHAQDACVGAAWDISMRARTQLPRAPGQQCQVSCADGAGGGIGGDCVPVESNHEKFFAAAPGTAWEIVIEECAHFQFLDRQSLVQQAICGQVR
jgi:hypothetical protein